MDYTLEVGGGTFTYDVRKFDYDWTDKESYVSYLTSTSKTAELYKAIHID
jgi:hypothetical protein